MPDDETMMGIEMQRHGFEPAMPRRQVFMPRRQVFMPRRQVLACAFAGRLR
jgi:hypothetical protein